MTPALRESLLLHGTPQPPGPAIALRAGPLSLALVDGDLREVRWRGREVIRRVYAAVRDRNWGTVPGTLSALQVETTDATFQVTYTSTHLREDIHVVWNAVLGGDADGTLRFVFDGEARSTFQRNRIGLCVLHPTPECTGTRCVAFDADGTHRERRFPERIAAEQPVTGFHNLTGLDQEVQPGCWLEFRFTGDRFETEDQRNWIDASFKTFCTPLRLPIPVTIAAGTRIRQEVMVRLREDPSVPRADTTAPTTRIAFAPAIDDVVTVDFHGTRRALPRLGFGFPGPSLAAQKTQIELLRALRPHHLHVDVSVWNQDWRRNWRSALSHAADLEAGVELALHLDASPSAGLDDCAKTLAEHAASLERVLILHRGYRSTTAEALHAARRAFGRTLPGVRLGAGTAGDLYLLNLERAPSDADFIAWSMNPQVHAFDNLSLAETPGAAAQQLRSVREYYPGMPLGVGPITFRPRVHPVATEPPVGKSPDALPREVDARQGSLFGAAWTAAMLAALAGEGAASLTFFETIGGKGVVEATAGEPRPAPFPSIPGAVFPLYHVLRELAEFAGGEVLGSRSSVPGAVATLRLAHGDRRRLILANLTPFRQRVRIQGHDRTVLARSLDSQTMLEAMIRPDAFRACPSSSVTPLLNLAPHAVLTIDFPTALAAH